MLWGAVCPLLASNLQDGVTEPYEPSMRLLKHLSARCMEFVVITSGVSGATWPCSLIQAGMYNKLWKSCFFLPC